MMKTYCSKQICYRRLYFVLGLIILFLLVVFGIFPLVFRYSYGLQRGIVFLTFVKFPVNPEYDNPSLYGMNDTRNFYITTDQDVKLGTWHALPASLSDHGLSVNDSSYEDALGNGEPIILYMHGNSGTRVSSHRVTLYEVLRNLNYHVVAFDYRSYADSSPVPPTEDGVVSDAVFVYRWLKVRAKKSPVFVWGHSLGTGISSHALSILAKENISSRGLILEAPFNNLRDATTEYPLARFFRFLPWFDFCITTPMVENKLMFESDKHIVAFASPVLILHAEDDGIVPVVLGRRLYEAAKSLRENVEFIEFEKDLKLGHNFIYKSQQLPDIVRSFVSNNTF